MTDLNCIITAILVVGHCHAAFEEELASTTFIHLAVAADSVFLERCVEKAFDDGVTTHKVTTECGPGPGEWKICFGFVGYSDKSRIIFVGYRGSVSGIQLFYEAYRSVFTEQHDAKIGGKISAYFSIVANNLRAGGVNAEVARLAKIYPEYEVWISGHSLGGALASIAAGELVAVDKIDSDKVKVITFGEPRYGDSEYASTLNELLPYSYRIANKKDLVTQIPPYKFRDYTHQNTEVWYPEGVKIGYPYTVCNQTEDPHCQISVNPDLSPTDHFLYYYDIVSHAASGCA